MLETRLSLLSTSIVVGAECLTDVSFLWTPVLKPIHGALSAYLECTQFLPMTNISSLPFFDRSKSSSIWIDTNREWLSKAFGSRSSALSLRQGAGNADFKSTGSFSDSSKRKRMNVAIETKSAFQLEPIVGFSNYTLAQSKLSLEQPMAALDCLFEVIRKHDQLDVQMLLAKDVVTYIQMKILEAKTRYQIALVLLQYPQILLSKRSMPLLALHRNNAGSCSEFFEMTSIHQALAELEYCHALQLNCKYLWQKNEPVLSFTCDQHPLVFDGLLQDYQATCEQLASLQFKRQNYVEAVVKYNEAKDILVLRNERLPPGQDKEKLALELARLCFHLGKYTITLTWLNKLMR